MRNREKVEEYVHEIQRYEKEILEERCAMNSFSRYALV